MLRELKLGVAYAISGTNQLFKANSELDNLKKIATGGGQALDTLKSKATAAGSALNYAFGQAKKTVGGALEVLNKYKLQLGMMAAIGAAVITSSVGVAGDVAEQVNASGLIFKTQTKQMMTWAEKFGDQVQRSKWDVLQWGSSFGAVFSSMGYGQEQTAALSKKMVRLGIDLGSAYNVKPGETVDRLTSALVGNYEATRAINIILTEESIKQFALRNGIIKTNREMSISEKIAARMGLMLERGALAFGDASNTAFSYNNQLVAFQGNIKDLQVAFGQEFIEKFRGGIIVVNQFLRALKGGNMKQISWLFTIGTAALGIAAGLGAIKAALPFVKAFFFDPKMLLIAGSIVTIALVVEDLWTALNGGKAVLTPLVNWFKKYGEIVKWVGITIGIFFAPSLILAAIGPLVTFAKTIGFLGWALKFQFLTSIWPTITAVWSFSAAIWKAGITAVVSLGKQLIGQNGIIGLKLYAAKIGSASKAVWSFLADAIKPGILGIKSFALQVGTLAKTLWTFSANAIKQAAISVWSFSATLIKTGVTSLITFERNLIAAGITGFATLKAGLVSAAVSVWSFSAALFACPITWIVAGVIALGVGLYFLWKNWDKVIVWFKKGFTWLKDVLFKAPNWVLGLVAAFNPLLGIPLLLIKNWDKVSQMFKDLGKQVYNILPPWAQDIIQWGIKTGKTIFGLSKDKPGGNGKNDKPGPTPGPTPVPIRNNNKPIPTPIPIITNGAPDQSASTQLTQVHNNNASKTNITKVDKIEINLQGGKNDQQTAKVVKNELDKYFGLQSAATVGS